MINTNEKKILLKIININENKIDWEYVSRYKELSKNLSKNIKINKIFLRFMIKKMFRIDLWRNIPI
jgi:hypothetical protein